MIRHVRFVGGPKDGDWEPVRDPDTEILVALPTRPLMESLVEGAPLDPVGPALRRGLYRLTRRRWNGGLVYEYDGPDAWAVCYGVNELSEPFPTKREAYEWLWDFLKDPAAGAWGWPTWPEVRWVPPA